MSRMKSKIMTLGLAAALAFFPVLTGYGSSSGSENGAAKETVSESAETSSAEETKVIEISDKDSFMKIYDDLTAAYVLTADIDFGGDTIDPIGYFEPKSDAPEDAETPNTSAAFTGTFDGNGHTLSNVKIDAGDKSGVGLFGCVTGDGAFVKNLKIDTINVRGGNWTGGAIGFADFGSYVEGIELAGNNTVEGQFLVGGVVGACHADIVNCTASAEVYLAADNTQGAGIIVGGQEDGNLQNCTATGKVTVGDGCYSIGGLAGCFHNSEYAKDCTAENIEITVGNDCWLVGALSGHSGTAENAPTLVENGAVRNVSITVGENTERIGGITGGGFYASSYVEYFPEPTKSEIKSCSVSNLTITGGKYVGTAVGYSYGTTTVEDFSGTMMWDGAETDEQIGADESVKLEELI